MHAKYVSILYFINLTVLLGIAYLIYKQTKAFEASLIRNQNYPVMQIRNEFQEFFDEIFLVSEKQSSVDKNLLIKTLKFMLQERDEYDPELVSFVKSMIIKIKRRTDREVGDRSQNRQSAYIDGLLNHKRNGFYIEAGAHDGEFVSNSLFFEFNRNWTGLLIEPLPELFKKLQNADRTAYIINACIAKKHPMVAKFRVWNYITGRESEMGPQHKIRLSKESANDNKDKSQTIYVPCFSLNTIMHALGVSHVDYFSLDIEGGEYDVVKSIDYTKLDITTFSIEYSATIETKDLIERHLIGNNYTKTFEDQLDFFFLKKQL